MLPQLVYLTYRIIIVHCKRSHVINCHTVPTTGVFDKYFNSSTGANYWLGHCDDVPTTHVGPFGNMAYRMILTDHTLKLFM